MQLDTAFLFTRVRKRWGPALPVRSAPRRATRTLQPWPDPHRDLKGQSSPVALSIIRAAVHYRLGRRAPMATGRRKRCPPRLEVCVPAAAVVDVGLYVLGPLVAVEAGRVEGVLDVGQPGRL